MASPQADSSLNDEPVLGRFSTLPAWLVSLIVHALVLCVLAWLLRGSTGTGLSLERTAEVGIALKYQEGPKEYFVSEQSGSAEASAADAAPGGSLEEIFSDTPPVDPTGALPSDLPLIGAANDTGTTPGGASGATEGPGFGARVGGGGQASLFGIQTEGNKFVYVFDRSGSMGGVGRNALAYAKRELLASIRSLDRTQQFEIIFYNESPTVFNPAGGTRLPFADDANKRRAEQFVASITADGGTRHEAALKMALRLRPDVVFFLTDADEPRLTADQLDRIHAWAGGTIIHTIEFGLGPKPAGENFLMRLARQNRGQYVYIDITRLDTGRN